jgi:hypothetical protein
MVIEVSEIEKLSHENNVLKAAVISMVLTSRSAGLKSFAKTILDTCAEHGVHLDV